jgi:chorismate mutase
MSPVRAIRGATTLDEDSVQQVNERVQEVVATMMERNDVLSDDIISVIFTCTADITSMFPATAARGLGLADVPLLGAAELAVAGAKPLCVRVMMHVDTDRDRSKIRHVYLHGARDLRDDLEHDG